MMRSLPISLLSISLLAGAALAAQEAPPPLSTEGAATPVPMPAPALAPAPVSVPVPVPAPAPALTTVTAESWVPPIVVEPIWRFRPLGLPYGPLVPAGPAHRLAMLEAGVPLAVDDPRVASAAVLLSQLTAAYVEDAPRIAALTIRAVLEARAGNRAASPMEMLVAATRWKQPPNTRGNIPRTFESFARAYRSALTGPGAPRPAAPSPSPPSSPSSS